MIAKFTEFGSALGDRPGFPRRGGVLKHQSQWISSCNPDVHAGCPLYGPASVWAFCGSVQHNVISGCGGGVGTGHADRPVLERICLDGRPWFGARCLLFWLDHRAIVQHLRHIFSSSCGAGPFYRGGSLDPFQLWSVSHRPDNAAFFLAFLADDCGLSDLRNQP